MQMQSVVDFAKSSSFCKEMVCDVAIWKGILDLALTLLKILARKELKKILFMVICEIMKELEPWQS